MNNKKGKFAVLLTVICWIQVDASEYFKKHGLRAKFAQQELEVTATAKILIPDEEEGKALNSRYLIKPTLSTSVVRKKRNKIMLRKKTRSEKSGSKRALPYDNPHPSENQVKKTVKSDNASNKQTIPINSIRTINTNNNNNNNNNQAVATTANNNDGNTNNANSANSAAISTSANSVNSDNSDGNTRDASTISGSDLASNDDALSEGNADVDNTATEDDNFDNNSNNNDASDDNDEEDDEELSPTDSPDDDESPTQTKASSEASGDGASNTDDDATNLQAAEDTTSSLDFDDDNDSEPDEDASPTDSPDGEKKNLILKKSTSKRNQNKGEANGNSTEVTDEFLNAKSYSELLKLEQDINEIAGDISKKRSVISTSNSDGNS